MTLTMRLIFILFLVFCSTAGADWSREDSVRQSVVFSLMLVDWAQTREIARNPQFRELNPVLGPSPSSKEVDVYFVAAGAAHYLLARALPPEWRKRWQYVWIGGQASTVMWNHQMGVRISF